MRILCAALAAAFVFAVAPTSAGTLIPAEQQSKAAGCGIQRVLVKQLDDSAAPFVHFANVATTVEHLRTLPVPAGYSKYHDERYDAESQVYSVQARLIEWKAEADHDYHIVISDPFNVKETMVVEPPDPSCPAMNASGYAAKVAAVRAQLVKCFGQPPTSHFAPFPPHTLAVLSGVLFFDTVHGERGAPTNGVELHPLLRIEFQEPCGRY